MDAELEKEGSEDMKMGDQKVAVWADWCPSWVGELSQGDAREKLNWKDG